MLATTSKPGIAVLSRPHVSKWAAKAALWFALVSLVFHSLLPLAYQAAMRRADTGGYDSIVICSAMGMRMVLVGADGLPLANQSGKKAAGTSTEGASTDGDTSDDGKVKHYVPLCLGPPMLPGMLPSADLSIALPLLASGIAYMMWMAAPPHGVDQAPARARGPPNALD